jgi:hypothetical protein
MVWRWQLLHVVIPIVFTILALTLFPCFHRHVGDSQMKLRKDAKRSSSKYLNKHTFDLTTYLSDVASSNRSYSEYSSPSDCVAFVLWLLLSVFDCDEVDAMMASQLLLSAINQHLLIDNEPTLHRRSVVDTTRWCSINLIWIIVVVEWID